jgi:hypothetical protein
MRRSLRNLTLLLAALISLSGAPAGPALQFALLKYDGGGDWYANPSALPNLVRYCNTSLGMTINPEIATVHVGDAEIFNYPFLHMTGHGNVVFSPEQQRNLREYLLAGGFLHIDDNYGMDKFIRPQLKNLFPELELVELPFSHPIYRQKYMFSKGLPKIHEHDGKAPQGFGLIHQGRLLVFYTYECDLGDGWEDQAVHGDSESTRQKALQMGANIVQFAFSQ